MLNLPWLFNRCKTYLDCFTGVRTEGGGLEGGSDQWWTYGQAWILPSWYSSSPGQLRWVFSHFYNQSGFTKWSASPIAQNKVKFTSYTKVSPLFIEPCFIRILLLSQSRKLDVHRHDHSKKYNEKCMLETVNLFKSIRIDNYHEY